VVTKSCGANTATQQTPATGLGAGTYTIVPLVAIDPNNVLPLQVTDSNGKPLTLVVPDKPKTDNSQTLPPGSRTTTITVTKKTTPPAQTPIAPTGTSAGPTSP